MSELVVLHQQTYSTESLFDELISANANTKRAHLADLTACARFIGLSDARAFVNYFISLDAPNAQYLVSNWIKHMTQSDTPPATINRRLSTLKGTVKLANHRGLVSWFIHKKGLKCKKYRDTKGPGVTNLKAMIQLNETNDNPIIRRRNHLIIILLYTLGLRRNELCQLDYADIELEKKVLWVLRKGETEKTPLTFSEPVQDLFKNYFLDRGISNGPLFLNQHRGHYGVSCRLAANGVYHIIRELGKGCGILTSPHRIRHTAITEAIRNSEKKGIQIDEVRQFSGHKKLETLMIYRDNLRDVQGVLSSIVEEQLK